MIGDFLVYAFGLLAQKARDKARDEGIAKGAGLVPEERLSHLNYQLACATEHRDDYLKALQELSGIADSVVTKHHVDAIRERMKTAEKERDKARAELAAIKEEPKPYLKASYERDFKKARMSCETARLGARGAAMNESVVDAIAAALDAYEAEAGVSARGPTWEELEAWCKRNSISFDRMRRGIEKHAAIREAEESLAEMKAIAELLSSLSGREWMDAQKRWDAAKRRYDNAVAAFQRTEKAHGE